MDETGTETEDTENTIEVANEGSTPQEGLEPVEHSQVAANGLQEVVARYGEAEWRQTYAGQESWRFNAENGILEEVMPDGQINNLTEKINTSATPEQQAKHSEILEAWKNGQTGFSQWREKTDEGEILHVTALTLRDNEIISETFSREIEPEEVQTFEPGSDDWIQFLQKDKNESADSPPEAMDEQPETIIDLNLYFVQETAVVAEGEEAEQPETQDAKLSSEIQPAIIAENIIQPATYPIFVERRSVEFKSAVAPTEPEPTGISLVFGDNPAEEPVTSEVGQKQDMVAESVIIELPVVETTAGVSEPTQILSRFAVPAIMIEQVVDQDERFAQPEPASIEVGAAVAEPNMEVAKPDSVLIFEIPAAPEIITVVEPVAEKVIIAEQSAVLKIVQPEVKSDVNMDLAVKVVIKSEPAVERISSQVVTNTDEKQVTIETLSEVFEQNEAPIETVVSPSVESKFEDIYKPAQVVTTIAQSQAVEFQRIAVSFKPSQATLIKSTMVASKPMEQISTVWQQTTARAESTHETTRKSIEIRTAGGANSNTRPTVIYNAKESVEVVWSPIIHFNSDNSRLARSNETLNPGRGTNGSSPSNLSAPDEELTQPDVAQRAA